MKILTCSNSCPQWEDGQLNPRSPGGLVPMLIALLNEHGGEWVFTAPPGSDMSESVSLDGGITLHPVALDEELRRRHYDTISIQLLLGMLHYMHDTSVEPVFDSALGDAWAGYETVNRQYAKRLTELSANSADELILLNDPHLMLVPEFFASQQVRRKSKLTYFLGTPWCEPDYFTVLPAHVRTRILESLLACDVVGFHARRWSDAFLACCARFLPQAEVEGDTVTHRGHVTRLVSVPFPLDVDVLDTMVEEPATDRWTERLARMAAGRRVMVRADRIDLWKNMPRGFAAYEAALERDPRLAEECWFVAVATPASRAAGRHLAYQQATEAAIHRINERFGAPGREAATLVQPGKGRDSRNCVVAALRMSTAAVVNSTYDGLNLFAKEAAYLLRDDASLLLSANAGVHEQLGAFALTLDPFDIDQTSRVMEQALRAAGGAAGGSAQERRALLRSESAEEWLKAVFRL
ncbi:trehalose-6-phosphate synthase [Streptomyces albus subsp. chlorinus]|uniref:trehalose-6-phosphate synthase n=1 Tax=Streptomyces albus TaxID=1888 RepID=UPI001570020F|nr:trehalose-6-phosphate synthase [Streptomyces albus]NSC25516.1 trehalose-6-phosphate synthase [Streptomyces albus subsp. chlorinus]